MYVEVELSFDIVRAEFTKTRMESVSIRLARWEGGACSGRASDILSFIPGDDIRQSYLVHSCKECE